MLSEGQVAESFDSFFQSFSERGLWLKSCLEFILRAHEISAGLTLRISTLRWSWSLYECYDITFFLVSLVKSWVKRQKSWIDCLCVHLVVPPLATTKFGSSSQSSPGLVRVAVIEWIQNAELLMITVPNWNLFTFWRDSFWESGNQGTQWIRDAALMKKKPVCVSLCYYICKIRPLRSILVLLQQI